MKKIIHHFKKIRQQPEHVRRSILYILTGILAVILFLFWVYSLGTSISSPETKIKAEQGLKPFSILKENIMDEYNNIPESQ